MQAVGDDHGDLVGHRSRRRCPDLQPRLEPGRPLRPRRSGNELVLLNERSITRRQRSTPSRSRRGRLWRRDRPRRFTINVSNVVETTPLRPLGTANGNSWSGESGNDRLFGLERQRSALRPARTTNALADGTAATTRSVGGSTGEGRLRLRSEAERENESRLHPGFQLRRRHHASVTEAPSPPSRKGALAERRLRGRQPVSRTRTTGSSTSSGRRPVLRPGRLDRPRRSSSPIVSEEYARCHPQGFLRHLTTVIASPITRQRPAQL